MSRLPSAVAQASRLPTIVVTPFHRQSEKLKGMSRVPQGTVSIPHDEHVISVTVSVFNVDDATSWYFLEPDAGKLSTPLFDGVRHPYDVPAAILVRDSLFFGAATVRLLTTLDLTANWTLLLQDWEAATAVLALAGETQFFGRAHLTLHNSYDAAAGAVSLRAAHMDPDLCPGDTVLQRVFPLVRWPLFTVSDQFAADMTDDLLQYKIIAPHLQVALRQRTIVGIHNGPFKELAPERADLAAAQRGDYEPIRAWKARRRDSAVEALSAHVSTDSRPLWGDKLKFRRDGSPWFVMAGRDDPELHFRMLVDGAHSTHRDQSVHAIVITGTTAS